MPLALATAGALAGYDFHIHYSRLGSNQIADPFFTGLALLMLFRGHDRRSPLDWAWCGVVVGVAQYSYAGARFTGLLVALVIVSFFVRNHSSVWREQRRGLFALVGAALIVSAPMVQYAVRFPNDYNARLNQVGIIQNGQLAREAAARGGDVTAVLFDQFQRAALAFNVYPDRTAWYAAPRPLFDSAPAALFLLGLGYGTLHLFDRRLFPFTVWWWGSSSSAGH